MSSSIYLQYFLMLELKISTNMLLIDDSTFGDGYFYTTFIQNNRSSENCWINFGNFLINDKEKSNKYLRDSDENWVVYYLLDTIRLNNSLQAYFCKIYSNFNEGFEKGFSFCTHYFIAK